MLAMGFTFDDPQFADQERWWRAAVEADPGSGIAPGRYGNFLAAVGRIREAMDMQLHAAQMRRNWRVTRTARLFAAAGDWRQAAALYDLTRPLDPAGVAASELQTYLMYGDLDTAARMLRERAEAAGRDLGCWKLLLRARRHEPYDRTAFAEQCGQRFETASLYAIAGDIDGAYREIDRLITAEDSFDTPHLFGPEMAPLRRDPRFWPLAARLGFTAYWLEPGHWPDFCAAPDHLVDCPESARQAQAALPAKQGVHDR
jgi:tetratricopeptide (TPR) repeat protein